jgi:DnaJ-class molecular chaperone
MSESEKKKVYHKLAIRLHPDKAVNCTKEEKEEGYKKFTELQELMSDPKYEGRGVYR